MSKVDQKITFYKEVMDNMAISYEDELFDKITRGLGTRLYSNVTLPLYLLQIHLNC